MLSFVMSRLQQDGGNAGTLVAASVRSAFSITGQAFPSALLLLILYCFVLAQNCFAGHHVQKTFAADLSLQGALYTLSNYGPGGTQQPGTSGELSANAGKRFKRAFAYFKKRNFADAAQMFATLHAEVPDNLRVTTLLGDCYVHLRRYDVAIALLAPMEKMHADDLDLEWVLGMALIGAGQLREGLVRVQKVAYQGNRAVAYLLASEVYLKLTFYREARANADAAIRLDPNLPGAFTVKGIIDTFFGDMSGAESAFKKALQVNPNDAQAHLQLGVVYYTERRLDAARKHLDRALELEPNSVFALYELARVERIQGHLHMAARDLERAERVNPQWLPIHIELAAIYYLLKRPADGAREKKIVDRLAAEDGTSFSLRRGFSVEVPGVK